MKRRKVSKRRSSKFFRTTARRTHRSNLHRRNSYGGYRF